MLRDKAVGDALIIGAGPLGAALSSIALTLLLSWNFAPEVLGVLAVLELVAFFFVMALTLGLDQAYVREFASVQDQRALFAAAVRLPFLSGLGIVAIGALVLPLFDIDIVPQAGRYGTFIALFYGFAALLIRMLSIHLGMAGPPLIFALLQVAQRGSTVVFVSIFLCLSASRDLVTAMLCYLSGAGVAIALHFFFCRRVMTYSVAHPVDRSLAAGLLRFGTPSALAAFLYALLSSSDRMSLALTGNDKDLGIYVVALSVAGSVSIFTSLFAILWALLVYGNEDRARGPAATSPYLEVITLLTFLAAALVASLAWFLPMLFHADYAGIAAFVSACKAVPLLYILFEAFGIGIGVLSRMSFATIASALGAAVALGTCLVLVPTHGARRVDCGVLVGALTLLIARTEFAGSLWYRLPSAKMYAVSVTYAVGCATCLLWADQLGPLFPLCWFVFGVFCLLLFRQRVEMILSLAKQTVGWSR